MRILHLYKDYFPVLGGIENHVKLLAEGQAARGHEVTVLVTSLGPRTERLESAGVQVIKAARLATVASAPLSLALPLFLRRLHPDVTHLHFPYPVTEVANWLLGRGRRTIVTYHSDVVRQKGLLLAYAPLMRHILRRADRIIATSPAYMQSSAVLAPLAPHCTVVPLAVETARFAAPADPGALAALRAQWGPGPWLLFVGRHRYYKGLDDLIRALPMLPGVRLMAVGKGPMTATWQALAVDLGVAERVHFPGEIPDRELALSFRAADLFVLPSSQRSEAFGLVIVEAMAAGLPAITTELGTGTSWVNRHGETGLVVPPRDPAALAQASAALLGDEARRARLGRAAQARALAEFDKEVMVERTLALYEGVSRDGVSPGNG
ncbi:MAG: glycosyltransferase [Ardenticatenaceae bacterium]|nr:glycosyltransferase [Ardenticatenaceae bacterium]